MSHAPRVCDPCGVTFAPAEYLSVAQAASVRSCSHACSAARGSGYTRPAGDKNADIGTLGMTCVCADCVRIRDSDRSELIARYAAQHGFAVSEGPKVALTPWQLAARSARIRRARLEQYEPQFHEGLEGAGYEDLA